MALLLAVGASAQEQKPLAFAYRSFWPVQTERQPHRQLR
jgi:hypothetical protein